MRIILIAMIVIQMLDGRELNNQRRYAPQKTAVLCFASSEIVGRLIFEGELSREGQAPLEAREIMQGGLQGMEWDLYSLSVATFDKSSLNVQLQSAPSPLWCPPLRGKLNTLSQTREMDNNLPRELMTAGRIYFLVRISCSFILGKAFTSRCFSIINDTEAYCKC